MKKLFTFVALAATMFCASAASLTDELTYTNVSTWSNSGANTTFTSEVSGVQYELENVAFMAFMGGRYGSNTPPGFLYVSNPVGGIEAISTNSVSNFKVYLSAEELTPANYTTGDEYGSTDYALLDVSDKGYKYACVAILGAVQNSSYPTIVWNDELGGGDDPDPASGVKPGTDVISYTSLGSPANGAIAAQTVIGSETGAEYELNRVRAYNGELNFSATYKPCYLMVHAVDETTHVRLTTIQLSDMSEGYVSIYGSANPMDQSYTDQYNPIGEISAYGADTFEVPEGYEYIMLAKGGVYFKSMSFTWEEYSAGDDPEPVEDITDVFTPDNLSAQLPIDSDYWLNGTYTGESGTKYEVHIWKNADNGYCNGYIYVTEPNGEIVSVTDYPYNNYDIYLSATELTTDNYESGDMVDDSENWFANPIDVSGKGYKYAYIKGTAWGATTENFPALTWGEAGGGDDPNDDFYTWTPIKDDSMVYVEEAGWWGPGGSYVYLAFPGETGTPDSNLNEEVNNYVINGGYITDSNGNVITSTVIMMFPGENYAGFEIPEGLNDGEVYTCYVPAGNYGPYEYDESWNAILTKANPDFSVVFTTSELVDIIIGGGTPDIPTPGVDTINYSVVVEQNPDAATADDSYATSPVFTGSVIGGGTGTEYAIDGVVLQSTLEQMYMINNYPSPYYIGNVTAPEGMWLKSITTVNNYSSINPSIYYSEQPFAFNDRYNGISSTSAGYGMENTVVIDEPARYFMIVSAYDKFDNIIVEWTDVKPVPTVKTPEISCYADKYVPGTSVYVKTATVGATLTGRVFINGEAATDYDFTYEQSTDWGSYTFELPGKASDNVRLEVVGSKEGWLDSETAVAEWTLSEPPCPRPSFNGTTYLNYVVEGKPVVINVFDSEDNAIEGAEITYRYHGYGTPEGGDPNDDYVYEDWSEWFTAAAPVEVTIPEYVKVGMVFDIEAKATAPGYSEGDSREVYPTVKSAKATAPTFSVKNGAQLEAGESFYITKDWLYPELYYTVNGEEFVTNENNAYVYINADTKNYEVVAWCGGGGFDDSDKVTLNVSLYELPLNVDVIVTDGPDDSKYALHNFTGSEHNGSIEYLAYSGYWNNAFYLDGSNSQYNAKGYIGNTTAGEFTITKIRVDINNGSTALVFFADEPLVDGGTNLLGGAEANGAWGEGGVPLICVAKWYSGGFEYPVYEPNQWIDLAEVNASLIDEGYMDEGDTNLYVSGRKFFGLRAFIGSQTVYVDRLMIEYSSDPTSVEAIAADNDDTNAVYYNLSGVRVDNDNLTPGLYIRVNGDKASKVIVK